ncbi:hypothetical protein HZA86_02385 [Candidatus Uhrbacteria bacterium]|nr:hypothetical protein [Candidatus Uhrbacteria bacterium]
MLEKDPQTANIDELEQSLADIEIGGEWGDARNILNLFKQQPELLDETKTDPALVERFWKLWARAAFMAFLSLNSSEIGILYKEHIVDVFDHHDDPRLVLDEQLRSIAYRIEPAVLQTVLDALEVNTQRLGDEYIQRKNGKEVPPEVRAWLNEYRATYDRGVERGAMEEVTFVNRNPNVQKLSRRQKQLLRKIIQFDDYLLFPDPLPGSQEFYLKKLVDEALWKEEFEAKQKAAETTASARAAVPVRSADPKPAIARPGRMAPFVSVPMESARPAQSPHPAPLPMGEGASREIPDPIVEIRTMAETGGLFPLLAGKPLTPANLANALRLAYGKRAGLTDELAAREAVHVGNILKRKGKPEFLQMAYYDRKNETFLWNDFNGK